MAGAHIAVKARVLVRPKDGILDPQGQAVERALPALGFSGVGHVRIGRLVELEVEDPARLPEMCERLLANPLIEDWEIHVDEVGAGGRSVASEAEVAASPASGPVGDEGGVS